MHYDCRGPDCIGRREDIMTGHRSICAALLGGAALLAAAPAPAADVTPQRLLNPDREPQNWLPPYER
jgi:hypothetical protein